jgi:hypothetical protein
VWWVHSMCEFLPILRRRVCSPEHCQKYERDANSNRAGGSCSWQRNVCAKDAIARNDGTACMVNPAVFHLSGMTCKPLASTRRLRRSRHVLCSSVHHDDSRFLGVTNRVNKPRWSNDEVCVTRAKIVGGFWTRTNNHEVQRKRPVPGIPPTLKRMASSSSAAFAGFKRFHLPEFKFPGQPVPAKL